MRGWTHPIFGHTLFPWIAGRGGTIGVLADMGQVELYAYGRMVPTFEDRVITRLSLEDAAQLAADLLEAVETERNKQDGC